MTQANLKEIAKDFVYGQTEYQEYTIDVTTKNKSFITLFKVLKSLNILNNKFFLRLYDKSLAGIDPHSKNLSIEVQTKIIIEITKNPYYFLREVIKIPVVGGTLDFELHRGNLALSFCIFNNLDFIIELPRQRYKTVTIICCLLWIYYFSTTNSTMIFSNKEAENVKAMLKIFNDITGALPEFLIEVISDRKDINNIESRISSKTNNKITVLNPPNSVDMADMKGRGLSSPILWFDEYGFIKYNDIMFKAAAPAFSTVADIAKSKGKPYCKILSTTPSNLDIPHGRHCREVIDESCRFNEKFYDWDIEDIKLFIESNSTNDFIYIKFTWKELGLSDKWYEKQKRSLFNDSLKIKRELDLEWTRSSDNSVYTEDQLDVLFSMIRPFNYKEYLTVSKINEQEELIKRKYELDLYEPLIKDKKYLIGVDVSGGFGRDYSALVIVDPETLLPIGIFKNNRINTSFFASLLEYLITNIIPNGILIIESNSYGKNIIDYLLRVKEDNVYYDYIVPDNDKADTFLLDSDMNISYGVATNTQTRPRMFAALQSIVDDTPHLIISEAIYNDIKTLSFTKTGKIEHSRTNHDDCLMAYLMVRYTMEYSRTIHKFLRNNKTISKNVNQLMSNDSRNPVLLSNSTKDIIDNNISSNDLSLEDIVKMRDQGIDIFEYLKKDKELKTVRKNVKINSIISSTLTMKNTKQPNNF
jgi:hypothetical protein